VISPNEHRCGSLLDLIGEIETLIEDGFRAGHRWLFRGQSQSGWELQPTIERRLPRESVRHSEAQMISDFKRLSGSLSDRLPHRLDTPSWLALMRHHGVPTRLLDWTDSSYVALSFACEEGERSVPKDHLSAVWALNSSLLLSELSLGIQRAVPGAKHGAELDLSDKQQFEALALYAFDGPPKVDGLVAEISPRWSNSRMAFQQGTMLINCNHQINFEVSLKTMMESVATPWIKKLVFPGELREEIWRYLYERNVHPFTLFPDLDGLGRLLRLKNHVFWSDSR
jgi:hypothetical protein